MKSRQLLRATGLIVLTLSFPAATAHAQTPVDPPAVPADIVVPAGHYPFMKGHAEGTQNLICLRSDGRLAWTFLGPQATLFQTIGGTMQQISTHFLSGNPVENGLPRATWQHSSDTSRVWARAIASSTDPNYVQPGAIAWLLLQPMGTALGPAGGSTLARTTFIHRVNTSGGVAPAAGCDKSADVGQVALVPYSADYYFYTQSIP